MWKFKPNEKNQIQRNVVENNLKFIKKFKVVRPELLEKIINNNYIFHELQELYNIIPNWVVKTDLGRLLIIYFNGGLYSDSDCFIEKKFNIHSFEKNVILFTEAICNSVDDLGPRECKNPENVLRVANFCFGSKKIKHPFFKEVINECLHRLKQLLIIEGKTELDHFDILWVCGPDVITSVYHNSKTKYNDIFLYDNAFLNHKCYGSWR